MPELPEVENFRRFFDRAALGRRVVDVAISDDRVLHNISPARLRRTLRNHCFEKTRRHGKHLLARLDTGSWLTFHFGLTGGLGRFRSPDDDPRFDRIRFDFADGSHLAYTDQRLLGELDITEDPDRFLQERPLGRDALDPDLTLKAFRNIIAGRRGILKSLLMDQKRVAGIGNEYSDEILFQAGLHPEARAENLQPEQISTLYRTMRKVLKTAIDKGAGSPDFHDRLPRKFLLRHRRKGAVCPACGTPIETRKVGGRTAYYCPACQPVPDDLQ